MSISVKFLTPHKFVVLRTPFQVFLHCIFFLLNYQYFIIIINIVFYWFIYVIV